MNKIISSFVFVVLIALWSVAEPQQSKLYRIGVLVPESAWLETVNGVRAGLRELGLEQDKQFVMIIRDMKGNLKTAEEAARGLEREKVDLIYATSTNVALAAKRATTEIPIVFCAGTDPVAVGLVESFAKTGSRLTGIHFLQTDITGKRLEILKEIVPKLRRVVTFYNPRYAVAIESSKAAHEAARLLGIEIVERHFASIEELQSRMRALSVGEVDALFQVGDPMVTSQAQFLIDTANQKRLPTMFNFSSETVKGGLVSYSVNFYEVGRRSAKYVQRILTGVKPFDLPVEGMEKIELVVNLKTAKQIGLTIPPHVLSRADKVIK